jgi:hypothetical protein
MANPLAFWLSKCEAAMRRSKAALVNMTTTRRVTITSAPSTRISAKPSLCFAGTPGSLDLGRKNFMKFF